MEIKIIEHTTIPMQDGTKLAAKIWMPEDAEKFPVPAILEYIPYRKRDFKAVRDDQMHGYFAEHGYAGVRVDLRGSGDSEGILKDEYLQQELDDGIEIIKWLADQKWCTGNVGMIGISWGGFNGLQIAALQPPELKAIITVASSDDRYTDDVHYMGGTLLTDNLSWASTMFAYNSCPPDPMLAGEKWRNMWLDRLEGSGLWLIEWLRHQHRDDYWKHASVCEDYSAIRCPVFAISGWADGYTNTVFHLMENLKVPRKGLIGPWGHQYPHQAGIDPVIDFFNECLRWWDKWLKCSEMTEEEEEDPMIRAWMENSAPSESGKSSGKWIAEKKWPSPDIKPLKLSLSHRKLTFDQNTKSGTSLTIQSPLSVGLFAGKWCSYAESTDLPSDQREEDGGALVFQTAPLQKDLKILGNPGVELELSSNKSIATVAVRLSDVTPDGKATRVTYGILNLTHRNSHEQPEELEINRKYKVTINMNYVAHNFPAGNQVRLSVSSSYWPLAWPPPEPARLTIFTDNSSFILPIRDSKPEDDRLRDLGRPVVKRKMPTTLLVPAHREWQVIHNLATNEVLLNVTNNDPQYRINDINWIIQKDVTEKYSYKNNNYDTLRSEVISTRKFKRDDWEVSTLTRTILTSTKTHFWVRAMLDAYEGDTRIFSKSWDERILRKL